MSSPGLWDSLERMDRLFQRARTASLVFAFLAAAAWSVWLQKIAAPLTVAMATAILIMMCAWFRKEDLRQRQEMTDGNKRINRRIE